MIKKTDLKLTRMVGKPAKNILYGFVGVLEGLD